MNTVNYLSFRLIRLIFSLLFCGCFIGISSLHAQSSYQNDFAYFLKTLEENYAYTEVRKTDWKRIEEIYAPRVEKIQDLSNFIRVIEEVWNELYNGHMSINFNLPSSSRLVPGGADFWVEYQEGQYVIVDVREDFNADWAGLKPGMVVTHFNGKVMPLAIEKYLPKSYDSYDAEMYTHAANVLLAGTHDQERKITASWKDQSKDFLPDQVPNKTVNFQEPGQLSFKKLDQNTGYIRIHNSLGNNDLMAEFDRALDDLMDTRALILDLRETFSGGNSLIARSIMGRFISEEMPYQMHRFPYEEREYGVPRSTVEYVSPRGKTYTQPLIVLVSHWTSSMGEGMAIGFDAMKRAKVVGTKMAGSLGAINCFTMKETSMQFCFPVERLYHVNKEPREDFTPPYLLEGSKDALKKAMELLKP